MGVTDDRNDPGLQHVGPDGMQDKYLILSEEERSKGFVRPVRRTYMHLTCNTPTTMGQELAETYARQPDFYGATFCVFCGNHFPVGENGEFRWVESNGLPGTKVGT